MQEGIENFDRVVEGASKGMTDRKSESSDGNKKEDRSQDNAGQEDLTQKVEQLQAELESLKLEKDGYKDKLLRNMADMENLRKRVDRERQDWLKYGLENVLAELLPVLDSFEKACAGFNGAEESADKGISQGVLLVQKQLFDTLNKHGLKAIESSGKPFDPNLHQAISRVESPDVDVDTVKEEYAKGYVLHDRLLRPSMVSVQVPAKADKDK
ncbi:MAG: nucleotide exchange factor GrpE [Oligoflexales bacterium]